MTNVVRPAIRGQESLYYDWEEKLSNLEPSLVIANPLLFLDDMHCDFFGDQFPFLLVLPTFDVKFTKVDQCILLSSSTFHVEIDVR